MFEGAAAAIVATHGSSLISMCVGSESRPAAKRPNISQHVTQRLSWFLLFGPSLPESVTSARKRASNTGRNNRAATASIGCRSWIRVGCPGRTGATSVCAPNHWLHFSSCS